MADEAIKDPGDLATGAPKQGARGKVTKTRKLNLIARFRLKPTNLKVLGLEKLTYLPPDRATRA